MQGISDQLGLNIHCDLLGGYTDGYVDPSVDFKPAVLDATKVVVTKWIVKFKAGNDDRYAGVLRIKGKSHVAKLPLATVFRPDTESTDAQVSKITIPYQIVEFESLVAFQVKTPSDVVGIVDAKYSEKLPDVNVYRILFPGDENRPLQVEVLMHK